MTCNTLGGATIEIGQRIENITLPLTYADVSSMSWTEIGGLVSLGSISMVDNTSSYVPIASVFERVFKTTKVGGVMENTFVPLALDAGQQAAALAAADQKYNYAIRVKFKNGDALIFAALVLGKSWQGGQAVTPNLVTVPLQINSNIIEVVQPEISILSGSGYAGSVYASTLAGQWYAGGVAIAGETGLTLTISANYDGLPITLITPNGGVSNTIQMWMPTHIDGGLQQGWFDASTGVTVADGRAAAWQNRFTGGVGNQTQAVAANQPAYGLSGGRPAVIWEGESSYNAFLDASSGFAAGWVSCVIQYGPNGTEVITVGGATAVGAVGNTHRLRIFSNNNTWQHQSVVVLNGVVTDGTLATPLPKSIIEAVPYVSVADRTAGWGLGKGQNSGWNWYGPMFEMLILSAEPDTSTRQMIEGCLAHRNGIAGNLPASHPYREVGPRIQ